MYSLTDEAWALADSMVLIYMEMGETSDPEELADLLAQAVAVGNRQDENDELRFAVWAMEAER